MQLSSQQLEQLQVILHAGVKKAGDVLNTMLRSPVELSMPDIQVVQHQQLAQLHMLSAQEKLDMVSLGFKSKLSGLAVLAFAPDSASRMVEILTGRRAMNPNEPAIRIAAITEVGNILLSAVLGSIANTLQHNLLYTTTPTYIEERLAHVLQADLSDPDATLVFAQTGLQTPDLHIQGTVILLFHAVLFEEA